MGSKRHLTFDPDEGSFDIVTGVRASRSYTGFGASVLPDPEFRDVDDGTGDPFSWTWEWSDQSAVVDNTKIEVWADASDMLKLGAVQGLKVDTIATSSAGTVGNATARITAAVLQVLPGQRFELSVDVLLTNGVPLAFSFDGILRLNFLKADGSSAGTGSQSFHLAGTPDGDGDRFERVTFASTADPLACSVEAEVEFQFGGPTNGASAGYAVIANPRIVRLLRITEILKATGSTLLADANLVDWTGTTVASAATCDIGAAASEKVEITGTTPITSFGTTPSKFRIGRFAGALTLTHNATTLILPGGVDITTAAGDTFIATSDASGNWRVRHYQRASGKALVAPTVSEVSGAAPTASPAFTGNPTAPTPSGGDNDTSIATTAFVQGELAAKASITYVDNIAAGLDVKPSCRAATTANITRSAPQTIDGVSVIAGDRVLVKDQTAPAENGIFVVAAGAWTRATDMDAWTEVPGANTWVEEGTANGDRSWVCTSNAGGTLNTTAISWTQFGGTGAFQGKSSILDSLVANGTPGAFGLLRLLDAAQSDAWTGLGIVFGTWTPTLAFATVGNSTWAYGAQNGSFVRIGKLVICFFQLNATPTIGTGTGNLDLGGWSGTPSSSVPGTANNVTFTGGALMNINLRFTWPAGTTQVAPLLSATTTAGFAFMGSASNRVNMTAAHMSTGQAHSLSGFFAYLIP